MAPRKRNAVPKKRKANVDHVVEQAMQTKRLKEADSDTLFKIDTEGSKAKRKKVHTEEEKGSKSLVEEKKIERILKNKVQKKKPIKAKESALYDPWADNEPSVPKKRPAQKQKTVLSKAKESVKLAASESYNPSVEDYQVGIERVVSKQQALEALQEVKTTITLLSSHLISDEAEDSDEDVDAESDEEMDNGEETTSDRNATSRRRSGKLTRAQRNKQARGEAATKEAKEAAARKQILRDIANAKAISKSITKAINEAAQRAKERKEKSEKGKEEQIDLRDRRIAQVLLPTELTDSLRTLKAAGGLLKDHLFHLQKVGVDMGNPNKRRKKPRGRKKVVDRSSGFPEHMKKWKSYYKK